MDKNAPENVFGISEKDDITSTDKGMDMTSSDENETENEILETREMTLDDLKSYLNKNNVNVNEQNIQNYYNQIIENKKYVNEYNKEIKQFEEVKKTFSSGNEKNDNLDDSKGIINSKLSQIEKKLADLNVEKQKREDVIKSTINNIFNDNKSENSKNVNFETKNTILNMALNDHKISENDSKQFEKEISPKNTKSENNDKEVDSFLNPEKEVENEEVDSFLNPEKEVENKEVDSFLNPEKESPEKEKNDTLFSNEPVKQVEEKGNDENLSIKKSFETNENPLSNVKKIDKSEIPEKSEENIKGDSKNDGISSLSEDMKKGFEAVLNAIKGIDKGDRQAQKEKSTEPSESPKQSQQKGESDVKDKPKTPQKNYIEEYRESLRSNAPINGFTGIKGLALKANNIGSYL